MRGRRRGAMAESLLPSLAALALPHDATPTEGTGKRKVDGEYAETRLGQPVSVGWANERFRQVMVLLREFRVEWPGQWLLTADDFELLRVTLDVALASAIQERHQADVYDLNPTTWAIWLVQHAKALRRGEWTTESVDVQVTLSFVYLYRWLEVQHAGDTRWKVYDPSTRQLLHRYKLPFKAKMRVPPKKEELFKWRKGAKRLSDWMADGGLAPIDAAIQSQLPPALVDAPPWQARREQTREALWARVASRSRRQPLWSVTGNDDDAQLTRAVVQSAMDDSRAITDDDFADAFEELEQHEQAAQQEPQQEPEDAPIPVLAERIGPSLPEEEQDDRQLWHIARLLGEIEDLSES